MGMYYECDQCKTNWQVTAQSGPDKYGVYTLAYTVVYGDDYTTFVPERDVEHW